MGTVVDRCLEILEEYGIHVAYPDVVHEEVARLLRAPGIDDSVLLDLTTVPFVTIDNAGSRDLDQALYIERSGDHGYRVDYALADAAHFVQPNTALYRESLRRGVTFYLPGFSVPMLPPSLSEGIVSLNAGELRRALVFRIELDGAGEVIRTHIERARIRSRRKLTYSGVQAFYDDADGTLSHAEFTESLRLLKEVGERRLLRARQRGIVLYRRTETEVAVDPTDPSRLVIHERERNDVERYNEQISLLCNEEAARFLVRGLKREGVVAIYRVHKSPPRTRLEQYRELVRSVVRIHGLDPQIWDWRREEGEGLGEFLERLPVSGSKARISQALQRQAIMINQAAEFSTEPDRHHGTGAEPYARASSPMRQQVGIDTHHTIVEKRYGCIIEGQADAETMVEMANRTQQLQRNVDKAVDHLLLRQCLDAELGRSDRSVFRGTVLGLTARRTYVRFDDPPLEVKLYHDDLETVCGAPFTLQDHDTRLKSGRQGVPDLLLGGEVRVSVEGFDASRSRYVFRLVPSLEDGNPDMSGDHEEHERK